MKWEGSYNGFLDCHAYSHVPALGGGRHGEVPPHAALGGGHPQGLEDTVVIAPFNDIDAVEALIKRNRDQLACVLAEPILGDAGIIPPVPGFLEGLRRICDENDVVLIFDEIITGFRVSLGGAQELYGVIPDITCVAKAVGGGTPGAAAFGGKKEIMQLEADGVVLHGGTYSGNPMTLAGMNAALDILINDRERVYGHLNTIANAMVEGMRGIFAENGVPGVHQPGRPDVAGLLRPRGAGDEVPPGARQRHALLRHAADRVPGARRVLPQLQLRALLREHGAHQAEVDRSLEVIAEATKIVKERLSDLPAGV